MKIHQITGLPTGELLSGWLGSERSAAPSAPLLGASFGRPQPPFQLATALERFEAQFTYPLGKTNRFRISHGDDYSRFYRSLGETTCFVAERDGEVLGVVSLAMRRLAMPGGKELTAVYIGDLKIPPTVLRGRIMLRLAEAIREWAEARCDAAYGVVMGGSEATPEMYTGRAGVPKFHRIGEVAILRIPCDLRNASLDNFQADDATGNRVFTTLSPNRYVALHGQPNERSEIVPQWQCDPSGHACGRLEDTRRAKRLFDLNGQELWSAHLSCFAFDDTNAKIRLLECACNSAASFGFSHLFVAVDESDRTELLAALPTKQVQVASATVYGVGLSPGKWIINTAEI